MIGRVKECFIIWFIVLAATLASCSGVLGASPTNDRDTNQPASSLTNSTSSLTNATPEWSSFGLDHIQFLNSTRIGGVPLWQYIASLVYIFLAFTVSRFADRLVANRFAVWAKSTRTQLDDLIISLIRAPIRWITFVGLLYAGIRVYAWPDFFETLFSKAMIIIVGLIVTSTAIRSTDLVVQYWQSRIKDSDMGADLFPLIRKTLKVFVVIVAVLVISQNVGLNVTGLIASLSIGGLAIGLAAQDTLSNLFGAVAILVDRPFRVGQMITIGGTTGFVEAIGFRSTRVRNLDGHLVSIPNKEVGTATITNISERATIRTVMDISLTYATTPEQIDQATEIVNSIFRAHEKTKDLWTSFNKFADWSLNLQVVHWWNGTDYKAYLDGMHALNRELKRRFDEAGLDFAFPTQTVHFQSNAKTAELTLKGDSHESPRLLQRGENPKLNSST